MGKAFDFETREYAEDLYITRGYTLERVAASAGVSIQQIKTWSSNDHWVERRREYRQARKDIRSNTVMLRKNLIAKALESKDPQDVYAAAAMEKVAIAAERKSTSREPEIAPVENLREIVTPQDAIAAMQEAVQSKINLMLGRPEEISLPAIKDMKQALNLLEDMQKQYAPEEGKTVKAKELSDDTRRAIREIYGLK